MKDAKTLWIKDEYLGWILEGRKTVEVRVGYKNITRLQPGDRLVLNDRYLFEIVRICKYSSFVEMLAAENPSSIAPNLSVRQLLEAMTALYPLEKENLGVFAIEVRPLSE